ncbi:sugar phosphate nucleotidyltransferase [Gallibacterium salpingitidis]|uniref:Dolichyl-phosphate mannose synthase n=1 Tax=Gallibacterium salpingitidis TaxID=505341 RepID=A0A1A7NYL1_9PAST|nr:sugar phosphate nucleotidyltransferase [Gallibacterium salpingitidis]OBW95297.1 dolichyl-phosphate mannose synthase [Gallibacterium salpingitidis]
MKKNKIHLVMPMAGRGSRFYKEGYNIPKPLIEIYGKPFFYWATRSIAKFIEIETLQFIVLREHVEKYDIDLKIIKEFPDAKIQVISDVTEGAVVTCMKGIDIIKDNYPLVFNDCDHLFKCSPLNLFCKNGIDESIDGILLTFKSDSNKYSFIQKNNEGNIIRTVEKEVISNEAICGCYYFKDVDCFKRAALEYLGNCRYNEYYMSGVYNIMIGHRQIIKSMLTDFHVPFGVPDEFIIAKQSDAYLELI